MLGPDLSSPNGRSIFPAGSDDKESACSAGDPGSIHGSGRSAGEGNDNPLQYSCLENPMDGGAWQATVHGVTKSWTRLSDDTLHLRARKDFEMILFIPWVAEGNMFCLSMLESLKYDMKLHT